MMKTIYLAALSCAILLFTNCKQNASQPVSTAVVAKDSLVIPPPMKANLEDEIADTLVFNEKNTAFRILLDTVEYQYAIQRKDNAAWQTIDSFAKPFFLELEDWNKDGYLDILMGRKWQTELSLFNPTKNAFAPSFYIGEPDGLFVVDSVKHVYNAMMTDKFEDEHSRLFTIDNYQQLMKGYIEGYVGDEEYHKHEQPMGIYVYKFKNNTLPEEQLYDEKNVVLVEKFTMEQYKKMNTTPYQFYKDYWAKNASKF